MGFAERPVDLTDVLDPQPGAQHPGVTELSGVPFPPSLAARCCAFSFASHPGALHRNCAAECPPQAVHPLSLVHCLAGLLLIRSALDPSFQRQLVMDALQLFCEPPNHTNHVAAYPNGLSGVWAAAQQGLRLQLDPPEAPEQEPQQGRKAETAASVGMWGREGSGPEAESLLRRLRWATLGPQYDWTLRRYLQGEDGVAHMPLPPLLRQLAVSLADLAADLLTQHSDCRGRPEQVASTAFRPNAALINYYRPGAASCALGVVVRQAACLSATGMQRIHHYAWLCTSPMSAMSATAPCSPCTLCHHLPPSSTHSTAAASR
jgi:alkylated DNA repair protein alkB family protein 1